MNVLLAIPCYCESKRLPKFLPRLCEMVDRSAVPIEVQLVDDGSPQEEKEALMALYRDLKLEYPFLRVPLMLAQNLGKGGAVRAGWDQAGDCDFLAFADADGASPAEEIIRFLEIVEKAHDLKRIYIAIRSAHSDRQLERDLFRSTVAKCFNLLIRFRYDIQVSDTQCGLKAIPTRFFEKAKETLHHSGYAFDLELLLAAKRNGLTIETIPIDWKEIPGSHTNLKDALAFMKQILFRSI